jgi:hypothetical protein
MRTYRHSRLAGLLAAVAVMIAVGPAAAAHAAAPAHQARVAVADGPRCPAGTNWNNILHTCV